MNENTLILTEQRLAPRLFDAALTLIAWGGFLFFLYARLWMQLTEEGDHRWSVIIASFNTVLVYLLIAAFNGWLLILWYQYNRRRAHVRRRHPEMLRHDELAQSFNVTPQIMSEMSQYNLLTVYHDQIGRIIDFAYPASGVVGILYILKVVPYFFTGELPNLIVGVVCQQFFRKVVHLMIMLLKTQLVIIQKSLFY